MEVRLLLIETLVLVDGRPEQEDPAAQPLGQQGPTERVLDIRILIPHWIHDCTPATSLQKIQRPHRSVRLVVLLLEIRHLNLSACQIRRLHLRTFPGRCSLGWRQELHHIALTYETELPHANYPVQTNACLRQSQGQERTEFIQLPHIHVSCKDWSQREAILHVHSYVAYQARSQ